MKACRSCHTDKAADEFYKLRANKYHNSGKTWLSNDCRKCKNVQDHQRALTKKLASGELIVNCDDCGLLMRKMATRKVCLQCIGEK